VTPAPSQRTAYALPAVGRSNVVLSIREILTA
jgi:hypothetical protein